MTPDEPYTSYVMDDERIRALRVRMAARTTECGHYFPRTDMLGDLCTCFCPQCYDPVGDECVCGWCSWCPDRERRDLGRWTNEQERS